MGGSKVDMGYIRLHRPFKDGRMVWFGMIYGFGLVERDEQRIKSVLHSGSPL